MEVFILKFIFPQNYNTSNKLFGIIDYSTAILNICWYVIVFFICNSIFKDISIKIFVFIIFSLPLLLFSMTTSNQESLIYTFIYFYKFMKNRRVYLYKKNN